MALNVYRSKELIYFDPDKPAEFHGYYASGTSGSASVSFFSDQESVTKWEEQVMEATDHVDDCIPGLLLLSLFSDAESQRIFADLELQKILDDYNKEIDIDHFHELANEIENNE